MTADYADTLVSHEWLAPHGGSENVFEQIAAALPGASLQCLWNDAPHRFGAPVAETWLARTPLRRSKAAALPFQPHAWRSVDLSGFDRVVASSHAFGHQLAARAAEEGRQAFAYVHTPARYVWNPELDARGQNPIVRALAASLKRHDRRRTSHAVSYAANSRYVRNRIRAAWNRDATVIYPPVDVEGIQSVSDWYTEVTENERIQLDALPQTFVFGASRLIEYKRLDLTMAVGEVLSLPVVIAGTGPHEPTLRKHARESQVPVTFVGRVSDQMLRALYQRATLFAFMAIEDFGIMPVEAMAAGTPVLVNSIGGARESTTLLGGGEPVDGRADRHELRAAAQRAIAADSAAMARAAIAFGLTSFRARITSWVSRQDPTQPFRNQITPAIGD